MSPEAFESPGRGGRWDGLEREAASWLARRDRGFSSEEEAAFAAWMRADPRRQVVVFELERSWRSLDALTALASEGEGVPDPDLLASSGRREWGFAPTFVALAAAASLALLFALGRSGSGLGSGAAKVRPTAVAGGGSAPAEVIVDAERRVLPDGSVARLNHGSRIEVDFSASERRVRLLAGEASFSVVHNPARPFLVEAGTVVVRDVGTVFDVRLAPAEVEVLVTEGEVRVASSVPEAARPVDPVASPLVAAGQRAVVSTLPSRDPLRIERVSHDQSEEMLAWEDPRFVFNGQSLAEVAQEFNRYNRSQLVLADAATGAVKIGGSFRANHVRAFIRLLGVSFGVRADERGDQIILRKSP